MYEFKKLTSKNAPEVRDLKEKEEDNSLIKLDTYTQ
jgi:hypothetical protein